MKIIFIQILLFIALSALAQEKKEYVKLKGNLTTGINNEPLPFATLLVTQKIDNKDSLVAGNTSTESGSFVIEGIPKGVSTFKVVADGYMSFSKILVLNKDIDLGTLKISEDTVAKLEDVVLTDEKNAANFSLEKRTFDVDKNITAVGGTAEDLLKNIPSVSIDADGNATLRNASATVYVNGKPTQLSLAQIPSSQIESVEIISNPSAKYDASTSNGIINLVLKKTKKKGYNGSVSAGIGNNARYNGMFNLEYSKNKWGITAGYNYNTSNVPITNYVHRTNYDASKTVVGYYDQNTDIKRNNIFSNGRLAVDYKANTKNTVTVAGTYVSGQFNSTTSQSYANRTAQEEVVSHGERITTPGNQFTNTGLELEWRKSFDKKGRSLSFNSGYTRNKASNDANWFTTAYDSLGNNQVNYPETDKITGSTLGNQWVGQLDYVSPVRDSSKIEMGLRSFINARDQQYFFNQLQNTSLEYTLLPNYSQNALITEKVNAAYALYTTKVKHKIQIQGGIRLELSSLKGDSRMDPPTNFGYDFPSSSGKNLIKALFPSFAVQKTINKDSELGFNLSRKIGRPGWRQFFVGIQSNDRQNVTMGNPALQPEFTNFAEFNYNRHWKKIDWLASAYYEYEDNTIKPLVQTSATDSSILITTFVNAKADIQTGIDNTFTFKLFKGLSVMANFNGYHKQLQTETYSKSLWVYNAKLNITYKLPKNFLVQINANNTSRTPQLQGYRAAVRTIDFAVKKSFWKNKANALFSINDVFNSNRQITTYEQATVYQKSMSRRDIRYFKFTLQYTFGSDPNASPKKKPTRTENAPNMDLGD